MGLTGLMSLLSTGLSRASPVPQFENINSSELSLLYGPTLTSVHNYWKKHSFDWDPLKLQANLQLSQIESLIAKINAVTNIIASIY